jgi:hypothetical protein
MRAGIRGGYAYAVTASLINCSRGGPVESIRPRLQIVRERTKSGRRLVVLEGFGKPAHACSPGTQLGDGLIFRWWHDFPHYLVQGSAGTSLPWCPDEPASDGASQHAIRSVVYPRVATPTQRQAVS